MPEAHADTHGLPTPRTTLRARYVRVSLNCRSCLHQADAELQGRGDPAGGSALAPRPLRASAHPHDLHRKGRRAAVVILHPPQQANAREDAMTVTEISGTRIPSPLLSNRSDWHHRQMRDRV
jgi:hypothetical protein